MSGPVWFRMKWEANGDLWHYDPIGRAARRIRPACTKELDGWPVEDQRDDHPSIEVPDPACDICFDCRQAVERFRRGSQLIYVAPSATMTPLEDLASWAAAVAPAIDDLRAASVDLGMDGTPLQRAINAVCNYPAPPVPPGQAAPSAIARLVELHRVHPERRDPAWKDDVHDAVNAVVIGAMAAAPAPPPPGSTWWKEDGQRRFGAAMRELRAKRAVEIAALAAPIAAALCARPDVELGIVQTQALLTSEAWEHAGETPRRIARVALEVAQELLNEADPPRGS